MKKNFISFAESLEASKRSICTVMISSYSVRYWFFFLLGIETWHFSSVFFFSCKSKVCIWTKHEIFLLSQFFFFHFCVINIFSIRDTYQVNTKEVNTQKSKLNYCLEPLLALLISLSSNIVVVSNLGWELNQSRRMCAPPNLCIFNAAQQPKKQTFFSPWLSSSSVWVQKCFFFHHYVPESSFSMIFFRGGG